MVFQNENTWLKASTLGRQEEFHSKYDEGARAVRKELGKTHPLYIGGEPRYSKNGVFPDLMPSDTRVVLGYFQKGGREDARAAIEAANVAFQTWKNTDYKDRVRIFRRAADIMAEKKFPLSALQTMENGKNRFEAVADLDEAIDLIRYYAEQLEINKGFVKEMGSAFPNEKAVSVMKPYGVWGVIPPFNFPMAITVGMSTGAMITGNTIILKPASDTPMMALKFYEILQEAGLPKGVINFVSGPGSTAGAELIDNPTVAGIAFTGSKEVGTSSYIKFAQGSPRPFIAEMGGKNAVIVSDKADLDKAVEGVVRGAFGYCGQKCSATSRVYVHGKIRDSFVQKLAKRVKELRVGDPLSKDVFMGPVINEAAYKKYKECVDVARQEAKILAGGNQLKEGDLKYGYFVEPCLLDGLPKDHRFFKEELFLPILAIAGIDSLEEGLRLANDSEYALTGGIFTNDPEEIETYFRKIEAGVVYANRYYGATTGAAVGAQSFVGWKLSGSSGKGAGGPYYLQQFLREQAQSTYS